MEKQHTVAQSVQFNGITLHMGVRATLRINPGEIDSGIWFRRIDVAGTPMVKAVATNVVDVRRGTTIASGNAAVATVEHVMSALHAAGIDNAVVDMDGPEPPILDGSSIKFFEGILNAGIVEQDAEAKFFRPSSPLFVENGGTQVVILPGNEELKISCTASFANCPFDPQFFSLSVNKDSFHSEIAPARTFVDYRDLKQLLAMGLIKGGSLDNAAILNNGAIICKEKLLWHNEIVRHKILDLIGDLYLCGHRVKASVIAVKPGHPSNVALAQKMIAQMNGNI